MSGWARSFPAPKAKAREVNLSTPVTVKEGDKEAKDALTLPSTDPGTIKLFQKFGRSCVCQESYSLTVQLPVMIETYNRTAQYSGHWSHVAVEHLKCGECDRETALLLLYNVN